MAPQGTFLFLGDELIADYDWQDRMPLFDVHSHGAAKETVEDLLQRLPQIEEQAPDPHIILVMTGLNNVVAEDYTFIDQIRRIIIRLSNHYPDTEIIINSLPNIKIPLVVKDAILHLNNGLKEMARDLGCCYLDNFSKIAGNSHDIFTSDGIHLTSKAYDQWARSILEFVAFLHEDD